MVRIATSNNKKSPFVLSVDGRIGKETLFVLANFSRLMAAKWRNHVWDCTNGRIANTVARSYSHTIFGARLSSTLQDRDPDRESSSGLGLVQQILLQNSFTHTRAKFFSLMPSLIFPSFSILRYTCALHAGNRKRQPP